MTRFLILFVGIFVLFLLSTLVAFISAYSGGVPVDTPDVCQHMTPSHGTGPSEAAIPYVVKHNIETGQCVDPGQTIQGNLSFFYL